MEQLECSYINGGNEKWYCHCGKSGSFSTTKDSTYLYEYLYTHIHIMYVTAPDRKWSKCTSTSKRKNELWYIHIKLPWWLSGKEHSCQCRRHRFDPQVRKIPWRWEWQPPPVFLPGESHGQRSLVGYGPWGCKELNMTEWLDNKNNVPIKEYYLGINGMHPWYTQNEKFQSNYVETSWVKRTDKQTRKENRQQREPQRIRARCGEQEGVGSACVPWVRMVCVSRCLSLAWQTFVYQTWSLPISLWTAFLPFEVPASRPHRPPLPPPQPP